MIINDLTNSDTAVADYIVIGTGSAGSVVAEGLSLDPLIGRGLKWVVKAKCPVVVGEWDFSKITFGHDEGHLVDATISQSTRSLGDL